MGRIITPTSADWEHVDFGSGLIRTAHGWAELLYPHLWEGAVGAWSKSLDQHPYDYSGNGNHGTLNGGVSAGGEGWGFDGTNHVDVGDVGSFTDSITLNCFIRHDNASDRDALVGGPNQDFNLYSENSANGSTYRFLLSGLGSSLASTTTTVTTVGAWTCIAGTYDGAAMRVFVSGIQENQRSQTGNIADSGGVSLIGKLNLSTAYNHNGLLNDIRIYSRALPAQDIATLALRQNIAYECRLRSKRFFVTAIAPFDTINLTQATLTRPRVAVLKLTRPGLDAAALNQPRLDNVTLECP